MNVVEGTYEIREAADGLAGLERFWLTTSRDGGSVLQCATSLPAQSLKRNILYALDAGGRPLIASIVLERRGVATATACFRFGGTRLHGDIRYVAQTAELQDLDLTGCVAAFGTHALVNDGWLARLHMAGGPARQEHRCPVSSVSEHGTSGLAAEIVTLVTEHRGRRRQAVPAGVFDVDVIALGFGAMPPLELVVRRDDQLLVRLTWAHTGADVRLMTLHEPVAT